MQILGAKIYFSKLNTKSKKWCYTTKSSNKRVRKPMNTSTSKLIFTNREANLYSWQLFVMQALHQLHSLYCYQQYQRIQRIQNLLLV